MIGVFNRLPFWNTKKVNWKKILNKYNEFSFKKKRINELKLEKKLLSKREIELNESKPL